MNGDKLHNRAPAELFKHSDELRRMGKVRDNFRFVVQEALDRFTEHLGKQRGLSLEENEMTRDVGKAEKIQSEIFQKLLELNAYFLR